MSGGKATLPTIVTTPTPEQGVSEASDRVASTKDGQVSPTTTTSPARTHHRHNSSLASAAGMLQVPNSESMPSQLVSHDAADATEELHEGAGLASPALSAYSDRSVAGQYASATALRDNDPDKANHLRKGSVATAFTDASGDLNGGSGSGTTSASPTPVAAPALTPGEKHNAREVHTPRHTAVQIHDDEKDSDRQARRAPVAVKAEEEAEKMSHWSKLKARLFGNTRNARRAAAAKALEAEKHRQMTVDPTPFRFRPYALSELVDPKSVAKLREMGGLSALLAGIGTNGERGLDLPIRSGEAQPNDKRRLADVENSARDASTARSPDGPEPVVASAEDRERVFGRNTLPPKKGKSLWLLMWIALQDKVLIVLIVAAIISLALGFYTDFGAPPEFVPCDSNPTGLCEVAPVDWVEGVAILVAVLVVVTVGSANDYAKERQLQKLNAQKDERDVRVIRQGKPGLMSVHDVQVGDILQIEPGEIIPADGIFLRGHNVKCDESGATGESDLIKKASYDDCIEDLEFAEKTGGKPSKRDPFLISGARVQEGVGEYVVTSVGQMSFNGKLMMALHGEAEDTPLQTKLNHLAGVIAKLGAASGLLLFIVLFIKFLAQLKGFPGDANDKGQRFISVLILAVTVVVVAIPEGLPLAVTLALAFATRRMAKQNLLVRLLGSCETMGAATVICTDKTGTLTQNQMSVVAGSAGVHCKFVRQLEDHSDRVAKSDKDQAEASGKADWAIDQAQLGTVIEGPLRELFNDSIAVNSTAFEESAEDEAVAAAAAKSQSALRKLMNIFRGSSSKAGKADEQKGGFVGSKTETALLSLAKDLGWEDYRIRRKANEVTMSYPFSSERKAMGVVVKKTDGTGYRFFVKGASEVITALCSEVVEVSQQQQSSASTGSIATVPISEGDRDNLTRSIAFYANQTLRTLGLAYKDFEAWPPAGATFVENEGEDDSTDAAKKEVDYKSIAKDLTLLSVVAIEDPLRDGVAKAVKDTHEAGLRVIMVTGDNSLTARSIAAQCGIYDPAQDPVIMEGPVFRNLSESDLRDVVPRLAVLARSSPQDKQKLVETLKSMGEIVAVTGDGTNDAAALKSANIGFSMGIAGTEIAKEASDIILLDDRFSSIVTALMWGRCVRNAVRKFLQFQLAVNVGAVVITFVTSVASDEEESALTAVQLLWLNLIMDTLAALALATDPATASLLKKKPERPNGALISVDMWKMIVGQAIYQIALVLTLNFAGHSIFGFHAPPEDAERHRHEEQVLKALTFNAYVWCHLFNQFNARRLDRGFNIFEGLFRNQWFILISAIEVGAQVLIIFVGGAAFSVTPLEGKYWAVSIVAGFVSWPLAVLIRLVPTAPIEQFVVDWGLMTDPDARTMPWTEGHDVGGYDKMQQLKSQHWTEPGLTDLAEELDGYTRRGKRFALLQGGWKQVMMVLRNPREGLQAISQQHSQQKRRASSGRISGNHAAAAAAAAGTGNAAQGKGKNHHHGSNDEIQASTLGVLVSGLAAAGVAGAWRPQNPPEASLADPAAGDPSPSSWQLVRRGTNLNDDGAANGEQGDGGHAGAGGQGDTGGKRFKNKFMGLMGGA